MSGNDELLRELLLEKYEPIAIVGVGLRFPGGTGTLGEFEEFLRSGKCGTGPIPGDRWDIDRYYAPGSAMKGKTSASGGGFLDGLDQFDAAFFNISPKEAQYVDPQHRLALEVTWEAFEDAGIDPTALRGSGGGIYFGISCFDYLLEIGALADEELDAYMGTGTAHSAVPGRLSYLLGWRGPSIAIDTACSSSLVALDLAVAGLRKGDCEIAVCGGVNAIHHQLNHIVFSQAGMLSPDGQCKTFDDSADGYARSEGCGALVLKRFSDARRAGDRILALIRGTAVRQDGESGGLTVPNSAAQEAVMRAALRNASLDPADIQYVEAHGTGTSLGDPIEMRSIAGVFGEGHTPENPIIVGSLKTNVGHMEAAAGIGGVIKTALQLDHARIYPHLHMDTPSRHIPWPGVPVTIPAQGSPWQAPVRRALVNSFGFAGTIASAVLEQAPPQRRRAEPARLAGESEVLVLSAKSKNALRSLAGKYLGLMEASPGTSLRDVSYTAAVGRAHFGHRLAGVVSDLGGMGTLLAGHPGVEPGEPPKVAMLFTGQGAQYTGMSRPLYDRHPVFREQLDECDRLFRPDLGRSIRDLMFGADAGGEIDQTRYTQPALFALEFATAKLWMSWGVEPDIVIGHSIGEVAAAAIAGLFSLEDAVRLVATRSRLMQSVTVPGGMVSVRAAAEEIAPLVAGYADVSFAAVNAPELCTLSGGRDSLAEIVAKLAGQSVRTKALVVSHAFHSPHMTEVFEEFAAGIAGVRFSEPDIPLVSNVTGAVAGSGLISTPDYWVRHIGSPVNFAGGMRAIAQRGRHVFIEVGPASTLAGLGRRCVAEDEHTWLSTMDPADEDGDVLKRSVAELYQAGLNLRWTEYYRGRAGRRITLPVYAFDRRRYWLPAGRKRHAGDHDSVRHPLLGAEVSGQAKRAEGARDFLVTIGPGQPGYLRDHVVLGQVVVPAACFVELLMALQDVVYGQTSRVLSDVAIHEPLILSDDFDVELLTRLRGTGEGGATVEISSRIAGLEGAVERHHVSARIGTEDGLLPLLAETAAALRDQAAGSRPPGDFIPVDDLYSDFEDLGLAYGAEFRRITSLRREGDDVAVASLRGHDTGVVEHLPPFLLDNVIQSVAGVLTDGETYLPVGFGSVQMLRKPKGTALRSLLRITREDAGPGEQSADLMLLDADRPVVIVRDLRFRQVVAMGDEQRGRLFHECRWVKRSLVRGAGESARDIVMVNRAAGCSGRLADAMAGTVVRLHHAAGATEAAALLAREHPADVCWFWKPSQGAPTAELLRAECEDNFQDLLTLLRALEAVPLGQGPRLWLVTERAQVLPGEQPAPARGFAAATIWGFGRSLWSEHPSYRVTLVDLDNGDYGPLLEECQAARDEEFQIAYRDGRRHVLRIYPGGQGGRHEGNFALAVPDSGEFTDIKRVPVPDSEPLGTEVRVTIQAAGLNFKDVLNALGMLKQHAEQAGVGYHPLPLGFEGAGTVQAAGPDAEFRVGDEVIVSHLGCMRKNVIVPSGMVVRKPANLGFTTAAGVPTAYVTAYYALHTLAGMKAGDRVLIHAAAGGVGQAAIALAKLAGAEVFATASPGKQGFLRAQGIEHIMNSRTLDFADEIAVRTGGAGVDIVLNSLNGDHIPAGIRVLAAGGHFVELGKIGVWTAGRVREIRPDISYHNFDLSELPGQELQRISRRILETIVTLLEDGSIPPITTTSYSLDEIAEAFGVLSRGANIGKLVIDLREPRTFGSRPELTLSPDETYLITGGLGALGAAAARKLAAEGARHLSVMSRRGADSEAAGTLRAQLGENVQLVCHQGDSASAADVERVMAEIAAAGHPLGGIVHAAGALADGPVSSMTWEMINHVFEAKVYGTWLLHEAAAKRSGLRFFAGYSSMASVLGPAGQANYAAANAFIDALMTWRAARGEPGLAISWGPWAEAGMAANLSARMVKGIESQGLSFLKPRAGLRALWKALGQPVGHVMAGEVDWDRYVTQPMAGNALYQHVVRDGVAVRETVDLDALAALPKAERRAAISQLIRARIAALLHYTDPDEISPRARFAELGVDSLTAVGMKNTLESALRVSLPSSAVFDYPTIALLTGFLDEQLVPAAPPEDAGSVPALADDDIDAELEALRSM